MLRKLTVTALLLTALAAGAAAQNNAATVIATASKAMGVDNLNSITFSGTARNGAFGQSKDINLPLGATNTTQITAYTRTIDFTPAANLTLLVSRASGPTQPPTVPGAPAPTPGNFNQNITGMQATTNWTQALNLWTTPWGFLKGAAANSATVRQQAGQQVITWTVPNLKSPSGQPYTVTGYLSPQNLVTKVETRVEHAIFGDLLVEFEYSAYQNLNGVQVPGRIVQRQGGLETFNASVTAATANPPKLTELLTPPPPPAPAPAAAPAAPPAGGRGGAQGAAADGGRGGAQAAAADGQGRGGRGGAAAADGQAQGQGQGRGGAQGAAANAGGRGGAQAAAGDGQAQGQGRGGRGGAAGAPPAGGAPQGGAAPGGAAPAGAQAGRGGGGGGQQAAGPPAVDKLGEGVFRIGGNYTALAIDMGDHILVIESGQSDARGTAVMAAAKQAIPNKPIRFVVNSHPHFDHASGLAAAVAEGATILTHRNNVTFLERALAGPRTLAGDSLSKQPNRKPSIEGVSERDVRRGSNGKVVELHYVVGMEHSNGMLMAYLPAEKVLYTADFNWPAMDAMPAAQFVTLRQNLDRLKLDWNTWVPAHLLNPADRQITRADFDALMRGGTN